MSGAEPGWPSVECRNIPPSFGAQNYFVFFHTQPKLSKEISVSKPKLLSCLSGHEKNSTVVDHGAHFSLWVVLDSFSLSSAVCSSIWYQRK